MAKSIPKLYEILLRGDANGVFRGAHFKATPNSPAQPITAAFWPEVCAAVNQSSLVQIEELTAALEASGAELKALQESSAAQLTELQQSSAAKLAELQAECDAYQALASKALADTDGAIKNEELNPEATIEVIKTVVAELQMPAVQRRIAELDAQQAALEAEREALRSKIPA